MNLQRAVVGVKKKSVTGNTRRIGKIILKFVFYVYIFRFVYVICIFQGAIAETKLALTVVIDRTINKIEKTITIITIKRIVVVVEDTITEGIEILYNVVESLVKTEITAVTAETLMTCIDIGKNYLIWSIF